ncbi:2-oxoglutarate synthase subunit alpha [Helicobacter fennelliae]|uniref:2-oxoglutarate oxidoreductase, alpha subunit n=2 Tax=Helicobacter fennelliae TaxID=215 RepID=T1CWX9_9HELI|nr:2-oxoglutarate synthase subunit alpha [Helicobacter fennelliae]GAD18380.1 2-oxoglutarate oxidoreductase, alpha subunit [Helicobacter fennelliae MRY12-0050]SQB98301.1 2-oxoglutarate:acceptor oxidoreductase subunit OorA [Helicobacter fennelliae]STP14390.1 2-oxoglutarate:acceptor oxidoreductase subunit OorA [Helicobacter fennelliae]STQ84478.1 2-oxoglutarate:acceptor oxidoreductase subunit OorA [Helicobacter fennelliae]
MREVISGGNELVAKAAIDVGCRFYGGYPITPSSDIMHEMSVLLPQYGGKFIQMEDEISGISVSLGASMSGVKAMTGSSGPGISLKVEQIGLAFMAEIPLVIADVMRSGPSTGMPTRVAQGDINFLKHPTHGDFKSVAIAPGNLEESYTQTVRAFNLAEELMTPVFLMMDETIGHMYGKTYIPDLEEVQKNIINRRVFTGDPKDYKPYEVGANEGAILNPFFKGYRYHITGLHHGPLGFPTEDAKMGQALIDRLFNKIESRESSICQNEEFELEDAEIVVIAYGSSALAVKEAIPHLRAMGKKVGLFRPITIWPSPKTRLKELGKKYQKIIVIELNKGQYLEEIERILERKVEFMGQANGRSIAPNQIIERIKEI